MIGTDIWRRKEQARQAALQMTVLCLEADSLPSGPHAEPPQGACSPLLSACRVLDTQ